MLSRSASFNFVSVFSFPLLMIYKLSSVVVMSVSVQSPEEVAFTVNNPAQVMDIGQSKDLGWCIGKNKRGTTCSNFINKQVALLFFSFSFQPVIFLFSSFLFFFGGGGGIFVLCVFVFCVASWELMAILGRTVCECF